jgi:predicted  nucleic acid-binding Zn-ribbon protein
MDVNEILEVRIDKMNAEIWRLRAEIAELRGKLYGTTQERDALRAELAAAKATAAAHVAGWEKQCEIATAVVKERDELRELLREARDFFHQTGFTAMNARIDAALNKVTDNG